MRAITDGSDATAPSPSRWPAARRGVADAPSIKRSRLMLRRCAARRLGRSILQRARAERHARADTGRRAGAGQARARVHYAYGFWIGRHANAAFFWKHDFCRRQGRCGPGQGKPKSRVPPPQRAARAPRSTDAADFRWLRRADLRRFHATTTATPLRSLPTRRPRRRFLRGAPQKSAAAARRRECRGRSRYRPPHACQWLHAFIGLISILTSKRRHIAYAEATRGSAAMLARSV